MINPIPACTCQGACACLVVQQLPPLVELPAEAIPAPMGAPHEVAERGVEPPTNQDIMPRQPRAVDVPSMHAATDPTAVPAVPVATAPIAADPAPEPANGADAAELDSIARNQLALDAIARNAYFADLARRDQAARDAAYAADDEAAARAAADADRRQSAPTTSFP